MKPDLDTHTLRRVLVAVSNMGLSTFYSTVDGLIQDNPSMTYTDALKQVVTEATKETD